MKIKLDGFHVNVLMMHFYIGASGFDNGSHQSIARRLAFQMQMLSNTRWNLHLIQQKRSRTSAIYASTHPHVQRRQHAYDIWFSYSVEIGAVRRTSPLPRPDLDRHALTTWRYQNCLLDDADASFVAL